MSNEFLFWIFVFSLQCLLGQSARSRAEADSQTCSQCSAYTCRQISGIYTVTVHTPGTYNPVVEIPASACSINITELARSDNYISLATKGGDGIINSKWALGQPGQYYGAGVRFSYDRNSGSCKGSCIYSLGPTKEDVLVEILYNDKNPGIAYEFTLPNTVDFNPLEVVSPASPSSAASVSSAETLPKIRFARREHGGASSRRRGHARTRSHSRRQEPSSRRHSIRAEDEADSLREYHPDPQVPRSDGRPDVTSAADGGPPPQEISIGTSYGSHTLGGRGLSYTYGGTSSPSSSSRARSRGSSRTSRRRDRKPRRHVIERYIPGSSSSSPSSSRGVRPASTPRYVSAIRRQDKSRRRGATDTSNYVRKPRYQSASSYREDTIGSFDRTNRYNRGSLRISSGVEGKQYRWKISGFSECSHTCGGGFQKTNIVCVSLGSRAQVVVTPENCANYRKPRQQTVACNKTPCSPAWEADPWSECSVTCGSGTQTRKVECRQRFSSTLTLKVSADECGLENKPAVAQQCDMGLCSRWTVGPWSECEECGGDDRQREIRCVDMYDSPIPGNFCSEARPAATEPCDTRPCAVNWWLSDWTSECSVSCGDGIRTRRAMCVDGKGSITEDRLCDEQESPILEERCRSDIGCSGSWFTGAWGKCSTDCGDGVRYRHVVCVQRTSGSREDLLSVTSDSECDVSAKPKTEGKCSRSNCEATWFSGPWGQCSVTCGDGYMSRDVRCIIDGNVFDEKSSGDNLRKAAPRESTRCVSNLQPDTRKVCSQGPCPLVPRYQRTDRYEPRRYGDRGREYTAGVFVDNSRENGEYLSGEVSSYQSAEDDDVDSYLEDRDENRDNFIDRYGASETRGLGGGSSRRADRRHKVSPKTKRCSDKNSRCLMVVQARLCSYPYYQRVCCHSCRKHALKH